MRKKTYSKYSKVNHLQPNCNANKYKKKHDLLKNILLTKNYYLKSLDFTITMITNKKKYDNIDS